MTSIPPTDLITIGNDGFVTVRSGKVELGTGLRTALTAIVAAELDWPPERIHVILGDTDATPDEGYTAGSKSIQTTGSRLAAAARALRASRGSDSAPSTAPPPRLTRVELPGMVTGTHQYVHDLVLPGMRHARVIRPRRRTPRGVDSRILAVDDTPVRAMPGVDVVRIGDLLAVVAEREADAIDGGDRIEVTWSESPPLPDHTAIAEIVRASEVVSERTVIATGDPLTHPTHTARYSVPMQAHASLGPACAVADIGTDGGTIWSATQGVFQLRNGIAPLLGLAPERLRVVSMEGSGCYGHNGADDVAADAALLSQAIGRPVRVQWSREDEFALEPKGSPMVGELAATLSDDGAIAAWRYDVWTPPHSTRPGGDPGRFLAASQLDPPFAAPATSRFGGGARNAAHVYDIPNAHVTAHWIANVPLHQSSLRSLGGFFNTTAIESFIDELAHLAGADPIDFRLRHLSDARARHVLEVVRDRAGTSPVSDDRMWRGRGVAFSRYESAYAYVALIADVAVERATGRIRIERMVVAHDCGRIIDADGVRNQVEGNVLQGISRTLFEEVTWDAEAVTSLTYATYPVLRFADVPDLEIELIDRPDEPPWGAGEPAICVVAAAIGNAVFAATGARLRDLPFTPERVRAAISALERDHAT